MRNQKISFIFFLSLFISFYSYSQRCDSILWSGYNTLQWKHFKGYPDRNSSASALSEASINYHFSRTSNLINFKFFCSFSTCGSWIKAATSYSLLEHEQAHFDLAEYYKRLMVKEVISQKFTSANILEKVQAIATRINSLRIEADELYDIETNYSRNDEKQKEWMKKIRKMVKGLDEYDKSSYLVKLN
ncbi:MAG: hypothetical protein V4539_25655 [Bacteroidota bacterium]